MVRRTKSMEETIKEGEQFIRNFEAVQNRSQIQRPQRRHSSPSESPKRQAPSKIQKKIQKKAAPPKQKEPKRPSPAPVVHAPRQTKSASKSDEPKQKSQKQLTTNKNKSQIQKEKTDKKQPEKQQPEKRQPEKKQPEKKEQTKPNQAKQPPQQPKQTPQAPRKTKSNLSTNSDKGKPIAGMVDCVFVVDTTGSMDEYLAQSTVAVETLVQRIKEQTKSNDVSLRFGFVCYRDHPPQEETYVTQVHDLTSDKEILKFINTLDCHGGGDGCEAALDGLSAAATEIHWRESSRIPSLRYIFHICDQPPHGREFGGFSEDWDDGCPCGLKPDDVIHRINVRQIHYRLIKAHTTRLEKFASYFKAKIVNYEEVTLEEGVADGMEIKISDMVIRELCPDLIYE